MQHLPIVSSDAFCAKEMTSSLPFVERLVHFNRSLLQIVLLQIASQKRQFYCRILFGIVAQNGVL